MTTIQEVLEAYKKNVREKFEEEKTKEYSSFLVVPSRARLRQLCIERFKNNDNSDDLKTFEIFLGFTLESGIKNKMQAATDKFRPIENFLKGESDLTDIEGINMAAILVDFHPRPFKKFSKLNSFKVVAECNEKNELSTKVDALTKKEEQPVFVKDKIVTASIRNIPKKVGLGTLVVLGVFGAKSAFLKEKQCMEWKQDHYEMVNCKTEEIGFVNTKIIKPYNKIEFDRKELKVCDTTTFYKGDKPIIWYSKKNNVVHFFNMDGANPENDAELKRVSQYIIDKYVGNCK
jgi:hypothetical protein